MLGSKLKNTGIMNKTTTFIDMNINSSRKPKGQINPRVQIGNVRMISLNFMAMVNLICIHIIQL